MMLDQSTFTTTTGAVLPVFALIGIGWLAGKTGSIPERTAEGLSDYVFAIAIPILIFTIVTEATTPLTELPWAYWGAYFGGAFASFGIGMLIATKVYGHGWLDSVIQGFASGQSNTILMGVPIILVAFGTSATTPLFFLLAVHMPVMTMAAMLGAEIEQLSAATIMRTFRSILLNPLFVGVASGVIGHAFGFRVSGLLGETLSQIKATATPCGLIALGLVLSRMVTPGNLPHVILISAIKLIAHPAIVLILCILLGVEDSWMRVAVAFAAMPCGLNAFLMAQKYHRSVELSAASVTLSTVLGIPTILAWLAFVKI
jgi:malonate transporter